MISRSFRNRLFATSALSLLALAAHAPAALAQSVPMPPEHYTLDARGVDLVSGRFIYATTEVAVGGATGLTYGRIHDGVNWIDASVASIECDLSGVCKVATDGVTEVFDRVGGVFVSRENTGSTLVESPASSGNYTYTRSGGAQWQFGDASGYGPTLLTSTQPNGLSTTYNYHTASVCIRWDPSGCIRYMTVARPQSYANNAGYMIHYDYVDDTDPESDGWFTVQRVVGLNLAVDYCDPVAFSCTLTRNWPSVTYAWNLNVLTATDQSGRSTNYTHGVLGLTDIDFPGTSAVDIQVVHLTDRKVDTLTDLSGAWSYTYSDVGAVRTTVSTGPLSQQITAVSDLTIGRATSVTDALSNTWTYAYNAGLRLERVTNPEGNYSQLAYDGRGNITQVTSVPKSGSGLANIVTSATYPSSCTNPVTCNLPTSTTDARGNVTDYTWDSAHGGPLTITQPAPTTGADRPQTRYAYAAQTAYYKNAAGTIVAAPSSVTLPVEVSACATGTSCDGTANEVLTSVAYGSAGVANNLSPTSLSRGSGANPSMAVTAVTYTANGDVETVDGPLAGTGDTTRYRYDDARQMVGVVGPDPDGGGASLNRAQRMTYSPRGQVTLAETGTTPGYTDPNWTAFNPLVRTAVSYDDLGRPLTASQQTGAGATGGLQQVSYDAAGRVACAATRMNPSTFNSLPTSACAAAPTGSDGPDRIVLITYDDVGRPTTATSAYGLSEAVTESQTYTSNGQVHVVTDGAGNESTFVYDGFDRPVALHYPNASGGGSSSTDYEALSHDAAGNVISHRSRAGQTTTIAWDNLNRPTTIDAPAGTMDLAYTYDNLDRPLTSAGGGQTLTTVWDPLSRLTSEAGPLGAMSYQYDARGALTRITWPDTVYVQYDSDLYGAVTAIRENGATSGTGVLATYGYNNLGQTTGIARGNGAATGYGYDTFARITSLAHDLAGSSDDVTFGYSWNAAGQISSRTVSNSAYVFAPTTGSTVYTNDGKNRVTQVGSSGVSYDANQNITAIPGLSRTYGYDAASRLISTGTTSFAYDPADRLYSDSAAGVRLGYAGEQLAGEYDSSGNLLTRHVPGPGLDQAVASLFAGGSRNQPITDERQSVIGLTNAAGGMANINRYDEYGTPASGNSGRFQYTGQMWLSYADAYHYRARAYLPHAGRFLQTDPIGYEEGLNLYSYVGLDPINYVDPTGLGRWAWVCVDNPRTEDNETGTWAEPPAGAETCSRDWVATPVPPRGPSSSMFGTREPRYNYFGYLPTSGPSSEDPQYPGFQAEYRRNMEANRLMWVPVLAPLALPVAVDAVPYLATQGAAALPNGVVATHRATTAYTRYGHGTRWQVRFLTNRLILRSDTPRRGSPHLNVEGRMFGRDFNFHIPGRWP